MEKAQAQETSKVVMNCQIHGPSTATLYRRSDGKPSVRCLKCGAASTRRYRKSRTSHPDTPAGSYFNGLRTTQGIETEKKQLPISTRAWKWVEDNHEKMGGAKSLIVNKLLEEAIKDIDPSYEPETL